MAVQICNAYGFNVKRTSLTQTPTGPNMAGMGLYQGEQVFVLASSLANAMAVLHAQYDPDLGSVTGGTTHIYAALTTMTGS